MFTIYTILSAAHVYTTIDLFMNKHLCWHYNFNTLLANTKDNCFKPLATFTPTRIAAKVVLTDYYINNQLLTPKQAQQQYPELLI